MKTKCLFVLAVAFTLLMGGTAPSPIQNAWLQRQLASAARRGIIYRFTDPETIEFKETWSSNAWLRSLREPDEATIRAWAASRGIPILEIDPSQVDTTVYDGWYTHFAVVPLSNGFSNPPVVGDLDHDGKAECYGIYDDQTTDYETRCYEIDSNGTVSLRHNYAPLQFAVSRLIIDADRDSLMEVLFTHGGGFVSDYEQVSPDSIPTVLQFEHNQYESGDPGYSGIYVGSLDGDSLTDFLYKGSEMDSTGGATKVYVAEYNQQANNFARVWSTDYGFGGVAGIGGFAVDDFDGDGRREFVVSESSYGRVFVTENVGDNLYATTWQDSTPFVNLYHTVSGDLDADGKPEFFVGGDLSNGNWTIMYEADSNNHYSPRFMFHIVPDGFFSPTCLTTDVDGDGHPELVILSSGYLHVFKGSGHDQYRLWYFKHERDTHSVQFYDVNGDGRKDILISKGMTNVGFFTDVYEASPLVSAKGTRNEPLEMTLTQNYPNPFNPMTTIEYVLAKRQTVTVKVFNMLGQDVSTLVDGEENPGRHTVGWNAAGASSGVYLCRLETRDHVLVIKLLLLK